MSSLPKRKGARIDISLRSSVPMASRVPKPILIPTTYDPSNLIHYKPKIMRPLIEKIVDMGLTEESHGMVHRALIREVKEHRNHYMHIYGGQGPY